ncbi:MAG: MATE family efflux transporter [Lachnospiraceae bacterium]|nr:MATE family efflux transporter [Lachnospiraceae bacterium]
MNTKNITDMTTGSTTRHLLHFALPLLVGNLFQQFYNMVDSLVVGNYVGANALAAVGNCGSMNFLFFSLSLGLSMGIGIIVAQYFGAKNEEKIRTTIANSIYVLLSVAVAVSVIGILISPALLRLLGTPATIIGDSIIYLRVTCAGIIGIALYNGVAAILRALGDSKTPLYFLIVACLINIVLDLLFVLQFNWGVFGVAFATIIAQAVSGITCVIYAYRKVPYFHLTKEQLRPDMDIIKKSFVLGIPMALQNSMIAISCMVLQGVVNSFGETIMAAYTIIGRIEQVVQQPYSSLGMAITTYTGQNVGAGKQERVEEGFRKSTVIALIFSLLLIPIAYLLGHQIIGAFVKEPEVIAIGVKALRINSLFYFALGMIYVPRALLNGAGDTGFAMINGLTEVAGRIGYSQILTRIPALGYWGIWLTTGATWATTAIVCVIRYKRGKWRTKSTVK